MADRRCIGNGLRACLLLVGLVSLSVLGVAIAWRAYAQPAAASSEQVAPNEAEPFVVERRRILEGQKLDPRPRFELRPSAAGTTCTMWRFEAWSQLNGHAVFELKEPVDKKVILDTEFNRDSIELVLGDSDCSYRIRIERNK